MQQQQQFAQQQRGQPQQEQPDQEYNPEPDVARNLIVNYIPIEMDESQVRAIFEPFGTIDSMKIICDRNTGQSRGYGFIKYKTIASAQQAIQQLNGYEVSNKRLKVALAANGNGNSRRRGGYNQGGMNQGGFYNANQYPNPGYMQQPPMGYGNFAPQMQQQQRGYPPQ